MELALGKTNYRQVCTMLRLIYQQPGIFRRQIGEILGVDRAMVTHIYNYLVDEGWIIGSDEPTKKKSPLYLNENRIYVAGIDIQPDYYVVTVTNIVGIVVYEKKYNDRIENIEDFLKYDCFSLLASCEYPISGIGIAIPGICDVENNLLIRSFQFKIHKEIEIPKEVYLNDKKVPVFLENDVRCLGWGKVAFDKEYGSFLLFLRHFIPHKDDENCYERIICGSTVFYNGKPWVGVSGSAGELPDFFLPEFYKNSQYYLDYPDILKMKGDKKRFDEVLMNMAATSAFLATVLDVEKVFFSGLEGINREEFKEKVKSCINAYQFYPDLQKRILSFDTEQSNLTAKGACGLVLEELFVLPCEKVIMNSRLITRNF